MLMANTTSTNDDPVGSTNVVLKDGDGVVQSTGETDASGIAEDMTYTT